MRAAGTIPEDAEKACIDCGEVKLLTEYHKWDRTWDGRWPDCKVCRRPKVRRVTLWRRYRITPEQYEVLLESQDGKCAFCKTTNPYGMGARDGGTSFMIDHDHKHCPVNSGCIECIRGLLCRQCNIHVGWFERHFAFLLGTYLSRRPMVGLGITQLDSNAA